MSTSTNSSKPLNPRRTHCRVISRRVGFNAGGTHGFTLIELMVVIGILISLATLTAISVSKVTKDARFSKSVSQVMNALENARTLAIKEHRPVLLAFTVKTERVDNTTSAGILTGNIKKQWTRIVAARLRDELVNADPTETTISTRSSFMDLFEPHPNFTPVDLPEGIKVAGPQMDYLANDDVWITQPTFRDNNTNFSEMEYGAMIGVMFSADGSLLSRITGSGNINITKGRYVVLDLDQDGLERPQNSAENVAGYFTYNIENEELNIQLAQFISVFNDAAMRELYDVNKWKGQGYSSSGWMLPSGLLPPCSTVTQPRDRMNCDESEFINQFGEKIYFNRYTGRAEVLKR